MQLSANFELLTRLSSNQFSSHRYGSALPHIWWQRCWTLHDSRSAEPISLDPMTTRSGRLFKPLDTMTEERAASPTPTESDATTTPLSGDDVASLVNVMRSMMRDHAEERHRYEEETERRTHDMSKRMERLEQLLKDRPDKDSKDKDPIKLT